MTRRRWPFWLWTGVILLLVLPWTSFQSHSHWSRVAWIPFMSQPLKIRDVVANVLLYVPWGYFLMLMPRAPRRIWLVAMFAAGLSLSTEAAQLYSHGRFPSMTDVVSNICGAVTGARLVRRRADHRSTRMDD